MTDATNSADQVRAHFDSIAHDYKEEVPAHIRAHLNDKWWAFVSAFFSADAKVVDLGCGDGTNVHFLRSKGVDTIGLDFSSELVRRGKERYPELAEVLGVGDILDVQHPDNTFDAAVITGVLHHIYSRADQLTGVREALRVVKPGGVVVIRESNLRNPLFRLYWNYAFPLTAKIDRFGGEKWLAPKRFRDAFPDELEEIHYFTFIPASTPRGLLPTLSRMEAVLEGSFMRSLSAHYIAVLRKPRAIGERSSSSD